MLMPDLPLPRCVAGENAGPPDDVGGPPGYEQFLVILADRQQNWLQIATGWSGVDNCAAQCTRKLREHPVPAVDHAQSARNLSLNLLPLLLCGVINLTAFRAGSNDFDAASFSQSKGMLAA